MKRGITVLILALGIIASVFFLILSQNASLSGKVIFTPYIPTSCSSSEISATWDSIFKATDSSGIILATYSTQSGRCTGYSAAKNISGVMYLLRGRALSGSSNLSEIVAIKGNFTEDYIIAIRGNITQNTINWQDTNPLLNMSMLILSDNIFVRWIGTTQEAINIFNATFKPANSSNWYTDSIVDLTNTVLIHYKFASAASGKKSNRNSFQRPASGYILIYRKWNCSISSILHSKLGSSKYFLQS